MKILTFSIVMLAFALVVTAKQARQTIRIAHITDIHIGESCGGNLTFAACKPMRNLADAVAKINEIEPAIDLVFVTGDITSSALLPEFETAFEILEGLVMPYFPILGNHDSWPYQRHADGSFNQTDAPIGDYYFTQVFGEKLKSGRKGNKAVVSQWPGQACTNGDFGYQTWHQNFIVTFPEIMDNLVILGLDWVAREDALPEPGVGPQAELHAYSCGTLPWLETQLQSMRSSSARHVNATRFFLAQHHPFHNRETFSPLGHNEIKNFTFDYDQNTRVQSLFNTYYPAESLLGVIAGHMHRWFDGTAWTRFTAIDANWGNVHEYETSACKGWNVNEEFVSAFTVFEFDTAEQLANTAVPFISTVDTLWKLPTGEWKQRLVSDIEI